MADLLLGVRHRGPKSLPPSKDDGIITVPGVHEAWNTSFVFTRAGFVTLYGVYGSHELSLAENTNSGVPWHPVALQKPSIWVRPTNGFIILRMRPL